MSENGSLAIRPLYLESRSNKETNDWDLSNCLHLPFCYEKMGP